MGKWKSIVVSKILESEDKFGYQQQTNILGRKYSSEPML